MQPQMSTVINRSFLLFILISLFSCSERKNVNCEESNYLIVNSIIEKKISHHYIPPPPENIDVEELVNDSIKLKEWIKLNSIEKLDNYKIAILPNFWNPTKSILLDSSYTKDYQLLVNQLTEEKNESPVLIEKIKTSEKFSLKYAPTNESLRLNPELWKDFDFILSFSKISFNDNCDKAVLIYSVGYERLNGYSVLVLMQKNKDVWEVMYSKALTIS